MTMKILDCESADSTYKSLERILEVKKEQLDNFFKGFGFYSCLDGCSQFDNFVFDKFMESTGGDIRTKSFGQTCWFHLTRTYPENNFKEGILPLGEVVDQLWDFLFRLGGNITKKEWLNFRKYIETECRHNSADHYRHKVGSARTGWGPFGILVKEIAFCAKDLHNSDQLKIPEIVEDICRCYPSKYGVDLKARFRDKTKPCIVKFYDNNTSLEYLRRALLYLYYKYHSLKFEHLCYTCFDGKGKKIAPEQILRVDFLI